MTTHRAIFAVAAVWTVALTGCSITTAPDEAGLEYNAGPLTAQSFSNCVSPSTREYHGPGDLGIVYPVGQRTFDFTGASGAESTPISATDKDGVTLTIPGVATFSLNDDCHTFRRFHEEIGRKYHADTTDGWGQMLTTYFKNPLDKAVDQASQRYTWRQMLQDQKIRDEWEAEVGRLARRYLREQSGGDYFCAPGYTGRGDCGDFALTIQKPGLPESILAALAETAAEVERKNAALNAKARIDAEAAGLQNLVKLLGPNGAVLWKAIQDGKVSVVPLPQGSAVNITPSQPTP